LKIDSQAEFRFLEKGRRMGREFKEDERPTSNVQRPTSNEKNKHPIPNIAEFRFFGKAFIPRKSKIRIPKSKISTPITSGELKNE
jgi:hypothetical protein